MTGFVFRTLLALIAPNYSIDKDNEGQIIIYTGLHEDDDDNYIKIKEVD